MRVDTEGDGVGRRFGWLWAAHAVNAFGTRFAFDALPLIAVLVLHAGPARVSALAAAGLAAGAALAVPLAAWVEFHRKRPVMVAMDAVRFAAVGSVPVAFALDRLGYAHLLLVAVVVAAADIAFQAASGAYLKALVPPRDLLTANARLESTAWTATALGPPLGGLAFGLFGPVTTVVVNAASHLLSAAGIGAIGGGEPRPARIAAPRAGELVAGWRHALTHPVLRPLLLNTALVNGLIMASAPLLAVLMLGELGFTAWQYGLAFAAPCVGGLVGSRLSRRLVARFGTHRVLLTAGALRACWSVGLAFVHPGAGGLVLVIAVELALITCAGVFNPVFATYRLGLLPPDLVARTLSAWTITTRLSTAALTGLGGLLAALAGTRTAIGVAGVLLLATPLLLPRRAPETAGRARAAAPRR
ncbi:MFS transporter [Saccharothrix sp. BKS2]|uniref:MFS transporter n=1 Tax=Saccharothrix sp. BKS2 TaxID=3064400 RepID=UPI0039EA74A0